MKIRDNVSAKSCNSFLGWFPSLFFLGFLLFPGVLSGHAASQSQPDDEGMGWSNLDVNQNQPRPLNISQLGIGFVIRDFLDSILANNELDQALGRAGLVAQFVTNVGQTRRQTDKRGDDTGRFLILYSVYFRFAIFLMQTIQSLQAIIMNSRRLFGLKYSMDSDSDSDSEWDWNSDMCSVDVNMCGHTPQARAKLNSTLEIVREIASITVDVSRYLFPRYSEFIAYGEASVTAMNYFYPRAVAKVREFSRKKRIKRSDLLDRTNQADLEKSWTVF